MKMGGWIFAKCQYCGGRGVIDDVPSLIIYRVLGPPNISKLMTSFETNNFVPHFLLGNNMVGPVGARTIANFVNAYPDKIETWYLAGNCIDLAGLERLVAAWATSTSITNIWLKRNPLGPDASATLHRLIASTANLRTLDLDQTEIGDKGVSQLFSLLSSETHRALTLRHNYLNGVGVGSAASGALGKYLASPDCTIESLYLSNNPMGDAGATTLAEGLAKNMSLLRLMVSSYGLKTKGAVSMLEALELHPMLMSLNVGQSFATQYLGVRYNWLEDGTVESVKSLMANCKTLRLLELGTSAMTLPALELLAEEVIKSKNLVVLNAKSVCGKVYHGTKLQANERLKDNIQQLYCTDVAHFDAEEKRWLISPRYVRLIDSGYRNRDMGLRDEDC